MSNIMPFPDYHRLRQRLAANAGPPPIEDQLEWLEACVAAALPIDAFTTFASICIRAGFSPQLMRRWREFGARTQLWDGSGGEEQAVGETDRCTTDIAIAELREFAALTAPFLARAAARVHDGPATQTLPHEVRAKEAQDSPTQSSLSALVEVLFRFLVGPPPLNWADGAPQAAALDTLAPIDCRDLIAADPPMTAAILAAANFQEFVAARHHLFEPPIGSAAALWRSARFDSGGLGPWFGNVGRIARRSKDVYELAEHARDAAAAAGQAKLELAPWLFLLSDELPGPLLFEVVDDLGDAGEMSALAMIWRRATEHRRHLDSDLIRRLRDAALDNDDYLFAAYAQQSIVDAEPEATDELVMLGAIYGSAGLITAAEQAFLACLKHDPEDAVVAEQLAALQCHDFDRFRVSGGYGTPEDRRLNRRRTRPSQLTQGSQASSNPMVVQLR